MVQSTIRSAYLANLVLFIFLFMVYLINNINQQGDIPLIYYYVNNSMSCTYINAMTFLNIKQGV